MFLIFAIDNRTRHCLQNNTAYQVNGANRQFITITPRWQRANLSLCLLQSCARYCKSYKLKNKDKNTLKLNLYVVSLYETCIGVYPTR